MNELNKMPEGLSAAGQLAYNQIMVILQRQNRTDTGGCKTFYSPAEWNARGEDYGLKSELIVVYDGGDVSGFFNYDDEQYGSIDEMSEALQQSNLFSEQCTNWYSAIYKGE